jgi:hypothetical protein
MTEKTKIRSFKILPSTLEALKTLSVGTGVKESQLADNYIRDGLCLERIDHQKAGRPKKEGIK